MKRVILWLLMWLFCTSVVMAQGPVYLPIISKGSDCMDWARLEISDGVTTVNLISSGTGFHLNDWNPQIIQPKDGGVFQDSPIAPLRRLVYAIDATAIEDFDLDINDYDQDSLIQQSQDLMRLLLKARAYQSTEFQDEPVWIRARAECETTDRFALIINWSIPQLDNPYAQPFFTANEIAVMDDITLQLERGHWRKLQPGTGECVEVSNSQTWDYNFDTTLRSSTPTAYVSGFARHPTSGAYYAVAAENRIMKSTDGGLTWANNLTGAPLGATDDLFGIIALANGNLLAFGQFNSGAAVFLSINDGAAWSAIVLAGVASVYDLIQLSNGNVIAVGITTANVSAIWYSTDNGASFLAATVSQPTGNRLVSVVQASNGNVLASGQAQFLYRSTDNGLTWVRIGVTGPVWYGGFNIVKMILASDDNIYALARESGNLLSYIFKSTDDGATWTVISLGIRVFATNLIQASNGDFYLSYLPSGAAGNNTIIRSSNFGLSWTQFAETSVTTYTIAAYNRYGLFEYPDILLFGNGTTGTNGYIYRAALNEVELGQVTPTCDNEVFIANRGNPGNITNVLIDDGGVFTSIFPIVAFPQTLFPAVPAANDALYFGSRSSISNSGPFGGLVFNILTPMSGIFSLIWEYWNGAAWVTLTVNDNTLAFQITGVHSVNWVQPTNWATTAVNSITAYWVRARLSAVTGVVTPATQQTDQIYAPVLSWVEIASTQVLGDIQAINQIIAYNQSDLDGPGGNAPNLYDNRVIVGLRSYERGPVFTAYINITDSGLAPGFSIALGTNTTFAADVSSPTGRRVVYNPAGVEAMASRATLTIANDTVRDYYGIFHAFLRARRTAGAATDLTIRLQFTTGSGGITFTTQTKQLQTTTIFEVLDFGEITLPVSGAFKSNDIGDVTTIAIQASAASGTPDLYLYDLILIPVDEWAIDAVDFSNTTLSDVGRSGGILKLLDIDSVTDPRNDIRTLVRQDNPNGAVTTEYNPITSGAAILQANAQQRLWFFAMQTSAAGASYSWLAPPEIVHSIQLYHNPGYLGMIGAR